MINPTKKCLLILLALTLASANSLAQHVTRVESVGITVSDMDRALAFYTEVLPFEVVSQKEVAGDTFEHDVGVFGARARIFRLKLGDEIFELTDYLAPEGRPIPADSRSNDRWFQHIAIVVSDMDKAYDLLRRNNVQHASTGPQTIPAWNKSAAGIRAFYFRDPDNHNLEILWFPPGKGAPKWHNTDRLFLGIDHTAIVVGDTGASLRFYCNTLGFKVTGESENYGTEQEHLNNVFGAHLLITSVRADVGPAIEFLEYLAPRNGRPYPLDSQANDIWHWQIRLMTAKAEAVERKILSGSYRLIAAGIPEAAHKTFMVSDPDGHALQIAE